MTNAGRVLMIPKGEYNSATTYEMLDFVYYQGRSYVCKQTSTGNAPTNTTYWQPMTTDFSDKMNTTNPTGTGSFSLNRKASTTVGNYSFAEGTNCTASGNSSHAEGEDTTASGGQGAHAEGTSSTASGNMSHAEGNTTTASGVAAHSEGMVTKAIGSYTHAGGYYSEAHYDYQTVIGKNNSNKTTTLLEVGNGSSYAPANRSNAFEVYSDGSLSTDNGTTKVKLEDLVSENQALTNKLTDEAETRAALGAHNILDIEKWIGERTTYTKSGNDYTFTQTGQVYANKFSFSDTDIDIIVSGTINGHTQYIGASIKFYKADGTYVTNYGAGTTTKEISGVSQINIDFSSNTNDGTGCTLSNLMFRLATDSDPTYQPYAKTNVELTADVLSLAMAKLISFDNLITTNADANDCVVPNGKGIKLFHGNYSNNYVNFPTGFTGGLLAVIADGNFQWQLCSEYNTVEGAEGLYFRKKYGDSWSAWKNLTNA